MSREGRPSGFAGRRSCVGDRRGRWEPSRAALVLPILILLITPLSACCLESPDTAVFPSSRIRAVLDSRGADRSAALLEQGDTTPSPHEGQRRIPALTWRGHPRAETRSFLITEFGILVRIDDRHAGEMAPSLDLGWMKNISERGAVGFTGYVLFSDPTTRLGPRARYRRWLSRKTSIDVSPGVLLGEDSPGYVLGVTLNHGDLIALTVDAEYAKNVELVHNTPPFAWEERSDVAWRAGAKFGSGLGLLGAVAFFGLIFIIGLSGGFE